MAVPVFIIISGYNSASHFLRCNNPSLKELYSPIPLIKKILWLLLPYTILFVFEGSATGQFLYIEDIGTLLSVYFTGGFYNGLHGGFYLLCLITLIFIMPAMSKLIYARPKMGLFLMFSANVLFEEIVSLTQMPEDAYRLLVFRYLFMAAVGIYMGFGYRLNAGILVLFFAAGFTYLTLNDYFYYRSSIVIYWRNTGVWATIYVIPIVYLLFKYCRNAKIPGAFGTLLSFIGRSTWHIFLFQMLYYRIHWNRYFGYMDVWANIVFNVVISLLAGCAFASLESRLREWIKEQRKTAD